MKQVTLTNEQVEMLSKGCDVVLNLSPKRTLLLSTKTVKERRLEALERQFEAKKAKLEASTD